MKIQTYTQEQLAAFGGFTAEVRSLLEFGIGHRAKRLMSERPHVLINAWQRGEEPFAVARALRMSTHNATEVTINA